MTEFILAIIIVAMMVFIYLRDKDHDKQINQLIKGIIAKNPQDMVNLTLAEKTRIEMEDKPPLGPTQDDFTALGSIDDGLFDRMITDQLKPDSGRFGPTESPTDESTE